MNLATVAIPYPLTYESPQHMPRRTVRCRKTSPEELQTDLTDARGLGIGNISEAPTGNIPARIHELRMVEDIEEFTPKLEYLGLGDRDRLLEPEVGVVEAGTVEESAVRCPESSTIRARTRIESATGRGERVLVEVGVGLCARSAAGIHYVNRSDQIRHICGWTACQ